MVTWFFLLHPVTFYGQNFENQKCLFELQDMFTKMFWSCPLNLKTGKRRKKATKDWINRGKKHFSEFLRGFPLVKYEK